MSRLNRLFQFLETSPNDSFLTFAIAKEYEKMKDKKEALNYYQKLKQQDPDYVGTYYHLGKLLENMEQFKEALAIYTEGMEIAKKVGDRHALGELAEARMMLEED